MVAATFTVPVRMVPPAGERTNGQRNELRERKTAVVVTDRIQRDAAQAQHGSESPHGLDLRLSPPGALCNGRQALFSGHLDVSPSSGSLAGGRRSSGSSRCRSRDSNPEPPPPEDGASASWARAAGPRAWLAWAVPGARARSGRGAPFPSARPWPAALSFQGRGPSGRIRTCDSPAPRAGGLTKLPHARNEKQSAAPDFRPGRLSGEPVGGYPESLRRGAHRAGASGR